MAQGFVSGAQASASVFRLAQGRLTLTTGVPVTTADVTGASAVTIYYTPYQGNQIALYTGAQWQQVTFSEISIAVPASTSQMYDVWAYLSAGVAVLELLAWTNDTTRATALATQDGILIKSGDATRRYLGSFRTTTVSGQTEDSVTKRYVWNYYNRVDRPMVVVEPTVSWTYSTATWRQTRATATNQLDAVVGWLEDRIYILATSANSSTAIVSTQTGIGLSRTNGNDATINDAFSPDSSNQVYPNGRATYNAFPPTVGRTFYAWLEIGGGSATQTWAGTSAGGAKSGSIIGTVRG